MGIYSPGGAPPVSEVTIIGAVSVTTTNLSVPTAGSEVANALPAKTVAFRLKARRTATGVPKMQIAYVTGESGTKFTTIHPGQPYLVDGLDDGTLFTFYIQSNKASTIVEIESFQIS